MESDGDKGIVRLRWGTRNSPSAKCIARLNCRLSVNKSPSVPFSLRRFTLVFPLTLLTALPGLAAPESDALSAATGLYEARRYAEAQPAFEALHEAYPDHPEILMYLGRLATKRQDRKRALDYFAKASALQPEEARYQFEYGAAAGIYAGTLGSSFSALTYARRAAKSMTRAIELDPENLTYRQGLIEFSLEAPAIAGGGSKRAHAQADAIAQHDPTKGAFAHAAIYRAEGKYAAALDTLTKLIALSPDDYFALFNFGRCAAESGEQLELGRTYLKKCLALPIPDQAPPPAHVWWNIATIEKQLGDRLAAIAALEEATSLAPHDRPIAEDLALYLAEDV